VFNGAGIEVMYSTKLTVLTASLLLSAASACADVVIANKPTSYA
jgi:hypothetical protein